ncbi:hypothetical protein Dimus_029013, partial [Dionaea muscipula]
MRSRRFGELCNLDPEIERTLRSIRAKRRLEFKQQNQEEMDDPPPANHVPAANGVANQKPLREYVAPQVYGALPGETSERKENEEVEKDEVNEHEGQDEIDERKNESNGKGKVDDQFVK